jgi:hypothetical protein
MSVHKQAFFAHLGHRHIGQGVGGNPEGPLMGITGVETMETPDPNAERLTLRIGIKKQSTAAADENKVKILVFLYHVLNDENVQLTNADVSNDWVTPSRNWRDNNPEVLSVSYVRPKESGGTAHASGGPRKYFGYAVLVYYEDKSEASQAELATLLQSFPPAAIAPPNEPVVESLPNPTPSEFAKFEMKLREREIDQIRPLTEPTIQRPAT